MTQQTDTILDRIGRWLAGRLQHEVSGYEPYTPSDPETLLRIGHAGGPLALYLAESSRKTTKSLNGD